MGKDDKQHLDDHHTSEPAERSDWATPPPDRSVRKVLNPRSKDTMANNEREHGRYQWTPRLPERSSLGGSSGRESAHSDQEVGSEQETLQSGDITVRE